MGVEILVGDLGDIFPSKRLWYQFVIFKYYVVRSDGFKKLLHGINRNALFKVPMQRNVQVGDNNIKVMFDIASLDCESLRMNNEFI